MNIIKHRKIFLSISGILVSASVVVAIIFGFQLGIDFVGGTIWQIRLINSEEQKTVNDIRVFFENDLGVKNAKVFPTEDNGFLVRFGHISEEEHQQYLQSLKNKFGEIEELRFEVIGPTIGSELKRKAIWAIILVLTGISLYVAFAFRKVSYPIKSWKYGVVTLITLFHDVMIPIGLLAVFGWRLGVELDTNFVVALLFVMGFSVHDTIVVFDRIRENILLQKNQLDLPTIVNNSINQTLVRSISTSLTLIFVLLALFFFGPAVLKYFVLTILIGITLGTYSSIFIASPLLLMRFNK